MPAIFPFFLRLNGVRQSEHWLEQLITICKKTLATGSTAATLTDGCLFQLEAINTANTA